MQAGRFSDLRISGLSGQRLLYWKKRAERARKEAAV